MGKIGAQVIQNIVGCVEHSLGDSRSFRPNTVIEIHNIRLDSLHAES